MPRRLAGLLGLATGLTAGTVLYRRTVQARRERVEVYYADGSMVSLGERSPGVERLLPLARSIVGVARGR
jgi:hypothetical protein